MTYTILHQTPTECRIKYVESKYVQRKELSPLTIVVLGLFGIFIGLDFGFVFLIVFGTIFAKNLFRPLRLEFEMDLNRSKNRIAIKDRRNTQQKSTLYPLNELSGFQYREANGPQRRNKRALAELMFKFDSDPSLTPRQIPFSTPVQKNAHLTTVENAKHIVATMNEWLDNADMALEFDEIKDRIEEPPVELEPEPEQEIFRDFRDMLEDKVEAPKD